MGKDTLPSQLDLGLAEGKDAMGSIFWSLSDHLALPLTCDLLWTVLIVAA